MLPHPAAQLRIGRRCAAGGLWTRA